MNANIYHEKQVRQLCALHALNNLFQTNTAFTKSDLDNICYDLSPDQRINPHKSILGLGNYDINVIMRALQIKGYEAIWFDKRKDPQCLNLNVIYGFLLNVPTYFKTGYITLPFQRRHWIAIKEINGTFYNLDSKLDFPQNIGKEKELLKHLKDELNCNDRELFLVVTSDVGKNQEWLREQ